MQAHAGCPACTFHVLKGHKLDPLWVEVRADVIAYLSSVAIAHIKSGGIKRTRAPRKGIGLSEDLLNPVPGVSWSSQRKQYKVRHGKKIVYVGKRGKGDAAQLRLEALNKKEELTTGDED